MKTWKNKACAAVLVLIGMLPIWLNADATGSVLLFIVAAYLFFTKKEWIW